jgi:hypothetical protein
MGEPDWLIALDRLCILNLGGIVNFFECTLANTEVLYCVLQLYCVSISNHYICIILILDRSWQRRIRMTFWTELSLSQYAILAVIHISNVLRRILWISSKLVLINFRSSMFT